MNWLNTISGNQPAYNLTRQPYPGDPYRNTYKMTLWPEEESWQLGEVNRFRHKDTKYFLPSEDEWYKSIYHANNGPTADYWDYGHGSNEKPDGIDFSGDPDYDMVFKERDYSPFPQAVHEAVIASPYGTVGQTGNRFGYLESAFDGINDVAGEYVTARGGIYYASETYLRSSSRNLLNPTQDTTNIWMGFRVASVVPEPSPALLLGSGILSLFALLRLRKSTRNSK